MFTGICAQRGANSSKHNHRSRTLPPAPPANSGRIRQGASASKTLILFNSARDAERGGRSAPARAAFLRRRNGLRCAALFLRLRTVPRPGLRPRAGWLRLRAGCAHASRGLRLAAPHGRRGCRLRAGSPPSRPPSGGEADGVRCLRVDRSATMCYTAYGWYADAYLKRPGIGACSEISRAFRCVYGRKLPEFHAFHAEFCRFPSNFGKTRTIPAPALAPRRNCVLPVAEGAPVRAPAAAGCAELNKIKLFCIINEVYENVHPILSLFNKLDERKILREIIKLKYAS